MPLITHCSTPHCPGYTEPSRKMCADCQARLDACPNCGKHSKAIKVTPATVVDHYEAWLAKPSSLGSKFHHRLTEKITVICIEKKGN